MKIPSSTFYLLTAILIAYSCSEDESITNPLANTSWHENRLFSENCQDESNELENSYACTDTYCMELRFTEDSLFIRELRSGDIDEKHAYTFQNGNLEYSQSKQSVQFREGNLLWDLSHKYEDCNTYLEFVPAQ